MTAKVSRQAPDKGHQGDEEFCYSGQPGDVWWLNFVCEWVVSRLGMSIFLQVMCVPYGWATCQISLCEQLLLLHQS